MGHFLTNASSRLNTRGVQFLLSITRLGLEFGNAQWRSSCSERGVIGRYRNPHGFGQACIFLLWKVHPIGLFTDLNPLVLFFGIYFICISIDKTAKSCTSSLSVVYYSSCIWYRKDDFIREDSDACAYRWGRSVAL